MQVCSVHFLTDFQYKVIPQGWTEFSEMFASIVNRPPGSGLHSKHEYAWNQQVESVFRTTSESHRKKNNLSCSFQFASQALKP